MNVFAAGLRLFLIIFDPLETLETLESMHTAQVMLSRVDFFREGESHD